MWLLENPFNSTWTDTWACDDKPPSSVLLCCFNICARLAPLWIVHVHMEQTDWSMMSWHREEGLFSEFINLWLVSDDLNNNNSHFHSFPSLINESIKLQCHIAGMSLIIADKSGGPTACSLWPLGSRNWSHLSNKMQQWSCKQENCFLSKRRATLVWNMSFSHPWHTGCATPLQRCSEDIMDSVQNQKFCYHLSISVWKSNSWSILRGNFFCHFLFISFRKRSM